MKSVQRLLFGRPERTFLGINENSDEVKRSMYSCTSPVIVGCYYGYQSLGGLEWNGWHLLLSEQ